jgi:hypothetical protein
MGLGGGEQSKPLANLWKPAVSVTSWLPVFIFAIFRMLLLALWPTRTCFILSLSTIPRFLSVERVALLGFHGGEALGVSKTMDSVTLFAVQRLVEKFANVLV